MAKAPKRPCPRPGCPRLVEHGRRFCDVHASEYTKQDRGRRGSARERGYDRTWEKFRAAFLHAHALCEVCLEREIVTPATVVDHIDHRRGFYEPGNHRALCKPCHDRRTDEGDFGRNEARPPDLHPSLVPVTIVCGPPGVGKSRYVRDHAGDRDAILDLDEIKSQLGRCALFEAGDEWVRPALAVRNERLRELSIRPMSPAAWLIVSAPFHADRRWWRDQLRGRVLLLFAPLEVCLARIAGDARRRDKAKHEQLVREWFRRYVSDSEDEVIRT